MATNCSAPVEGHTLPQSALRCPVHGPKMMAAAEISLPPLSPMKTPGADVDNDPDDAYSPDSLSRCAMSTNEKTRMAAASNERTPPQVLADLAWDEMPNVRHAVGGNPSTPVTALVALSSDESSSVRQRVACREDAPTAVVDALCEGKEGRSVAGVAVRNRNASPGALVRAVENGEAEVSVSALGNPCMPVDVLTKHATDTRSGFREAIAGNSSTSTETLTLLAASRKATVRAEAAANPNTDPALLGSLSRDLARTGPSAQWGDMQVQEHVTMNPLASAEVLRSMYERGVRRPTAMRIALHQNTPGDLIAKMADAGEASAQAGRRKRISGLGVDETNAEAIALLAEQEWWTFEAGGVEVQLALVAHGNL